MFRLTLGTHSYQATRERNGDSFISIINVGYDDDDLKAYSVEIGLIPQPGGGTEFYFNVVEVDDDTGAEHRYWCGKDVAAFMTKADRQAVLAAILAETAWVLQNVRPRKVQSITYDESPPDKALHKHHLIIRVFESCGYKVVRADPWHGKHLWDMELPSSEGC